MTQIAKFMGQTWGPYGADRTLVGPMLAPWTLQSGELREIYTVLIRVLPLIMLSASHKVTFSPGKHSVTEEKSLCCVNAEAWYLSLAREENVLWILCCLAIPKIVPESYLVFRLLMILVRKIKIANDSTWYAVTKMKFQLSAFSLTPADKLSGYVFC